MILLFSLLGDSEISDVSGYGAHFGSYRDILGWISISGMFILSLVVIIVILLSLILNEKTPPDLKNKLVRLLLGLVSIIVFLFLFDIAFAFPEISSFFIENSFMHFIMHLSIVVGALLVLSTYITTLNTEKK